MALDITYDDIFQALGDVLRYGRIARASQTDSQKIARIDAMIQQGARSVYFHAQLDPAEPPHEWSFMHPVATITLLTNDYDYDLAADFSALSGRFTWAAGENLRPLELIREEKVRDLLATNNTAGIPRYAALRPKKPSTGVKQTWEAVIYPKPSSTYNNKVLTYRYRIEPPSLGGTLGSAPTEKPLGGAAIAQLILAACMAQAELFLHGKRDVYFAEYQTMLVSAIRADRNNIAALTEDSYPVDDSPTGLDLTYREFCMDAAQQRGFGRDKGAWTHAQTQTVDDDVQVGYRHYLYNARGPDGRTHFWNFLRPVTTITTDTTGTVAIVAYNAGTGRTAISFTNLTGPLGDWMVGATFTFDTSGNEYTIYSVPSASTMQVEGDASSETDPDTFTIAGCESQVLPTDFQHIVGHLVPQPGQTSFAKTVPVVSEHRIREDLFTENGSTGIPYEVAVRTRTSAGTARQTTDLVFCPIAGASYILTMRYQIVPARLTSAAPYPLGGAEHAEALRACVRAAAASGTPAERDLITIREGLLQTAVLADRRKGHPETYGVQAGDLDWNMLAADSTPQGIPSVTYNGVTII